MSPEKTQQLIDVYPKLFQEMSPRSCMYLFGFECGDGWFDLLKECIEKIKTICEKEDFVVFTPDDSGHIYILQIKEKYGTLRFYVSSATDEIYNFIDEAEKKSAFTCERCGANGKLRGDRFFIYTACDACELLAQQSSCC